MRANFGSTAAGVAAPQRLRVSLAVSVFLVVSLLLAALLPAGASAAFSREFEHQISGAEGQPFAFEGVGASNGGGLGIDAGDDLWVGDGLPYPNVRLVEFAPGYGAAPNRFLKTLQPKEEALTTPASLAFDRSGQRLYLSGTEAYFPETGLVLRDPRIEGFDPASGKRLARSALYNSESYVAVDNSSGPSGGAIYLAHAGEDLRQPYGDGHPIGIQKLNASLEAVAFLRSAEPNPPPYLAGSEIIGTPIGNNGCDNGSFSFFAAPGSIAVDNQGNLYVLDRECRFTPAIIEYRSSGEFLRVFATGAETPGLGGNHERGGFGGLPEGIAFDPVSTHILVSIAARTEGREAGAVDEFDSSGHYLNQITETSGGTPLRSASQLAVDSHGDLYVVDPRDESVDVYGPGHSLATLRFGSTEPLNATSVELSGSVRSDELTLTGCRFQFVPRSQFEVDGFASVTASEEAPCSPAPSSIPVDVSYHQVHAEVVGLTSGALYRYRLLATTEGTLGGTATTAPLAFTAPHAPQIDVPTVSELSSSSASFSAHITPLGADTNYRFQYVTQRQFEEGGFSRASNTDEANIGSGGATGSDASNVLQSVEGLNAAAVYHLRVVATNMIGSTTSPETTFSTLRAIETSLPDHRAYELLTPPNKASAEDMFAHPRTNGEFTNDDVGLASPTGNRFLLTTTAGFGPFPSSEGSVYVFSRSQEGWRFISLASPSLGVQAIGPGQLLFEPSAFSQVALGDAVSSTASEGGRHSVTLSGPPGGPYTTLHADASAAGSSAPVGGSADLATIVLESLDHGLCPGAEAQDPGSHTLCVASGGQLALINANSKGNVLSRCGATLGYGVPENPKSSERWNAVSSDGGSVFFSAPDPGRPFNPFEASATEGCWDPTTGAHAPQLYLRSGSSTVQVSAPLAGVSDPSGSHPAQYVGAAEDGSRVFFMSEAELTKDDAGIHDLELYEWRASGVTGSQGGPGAVGTCGESSPNYLKTSGGCLARISAGESGGAAADVFAAPAIAPSGSALYFLAQGQLELGAPVPGSGEVDLYRYDTVSTVITYVATLLRSDYAQNQETAVTGPNSNLSWYTTPDGRFLLFASGSEVTGYPTAQSSCRTPHGEGEGGPCREVYRYDSHAAKGHEAPILCVSCSPSGTPPTSNALFARSPLTAPDVGAVRAMSDDGSYVFFDTADALVPQDTNDTLDVYEWEAGGTGSCAAQAGCISLLSSGTNSAPSYLLGSSADGSNVFFGTHAQLVPVDADTAGDLYDARICTSSNACLGPPPNHEGECEGDACTHPPLAPIDATPASLTLSGAGNMPSPSTSSVKSRSSTRAQLLVKALKACKRKPNIGRRKKCERQAKRRYGARSQRRSVLHKGGR